jgi:hypothetical protein
MKLSAVILRYYYTVLQWYLLDECLTLALAFLQWLQAFWILDSGFRRHSRDFNLLPLLSGLSRMDSELEDVDLLMIEDIVSLDEETLVCNDMVMLEILFLYDITNSLLIGL